MRRILLLLAATILFSANQANASIFSDNFDSGASPLWGNESGAWATSGGGYFATIPTGNIPVPYTSLPFVLTDFSFQVDIADIGDGGIWLRSQDNLNGVLLVTGGDGYFAGAPNPQAGRDLYWHVFVNGVGNPPGFLSRVANVFDPGVTDATIRVDVVGDTYRAYVNGTLVSTLVDGTYTSGKVALYDAVNPQQTFDNVELSAVPEASSLVTMGGLLGLSSALMLVKMYR